MSNVEKPFSGPIVKYGGGFILLCVVAVGWLAVSAHGGVGGTIAAAGSEVGSGFMAEAEAQHAADAVAEYQIAKRHGDPGDVCMRAQLAAMAWLSAKNDAKYAEWKGVERAECPR